MLFNKIPDYVSSGALNLIEVPCVSGETIYVSVHSGTDSASAPIFEDSYIAFNDLVQIFGIGDILFNFLSEKVGGGFTLVISFSSATFRRSFYVIPSSCESSGISFDKMFLNLGNAALCPPASRFYLSAVGPDIKDYKSGSLKCNRQGLTVSHFLIDNHSIIFDLVLPPFPGCYVVSLGDRSFTFFISEMFSCHSIKFSNHFNAPEIIYLPSSLSVSPAMSAQLAKSAGESVSFDLERSIKLDFHAKNLTEIIFNRVKYIGFGSDFYIDDFPVVISNIDPKHSREADELYELKFSAQLKAATPDYLTEDIFKIFKRHFNFSFN